MKSKYLKKRILLITLFISSAIMILFSSCKKQETKNEEANYYVKYIIKGNGTYGRFSNWTATTPDGIYTNTGYQTPSWSQTYGPVKKGFKCEVKVGSYISGAPTIEIHVSKNVEPFALKVTITGSSASYTIDF